MAEMGVVWSSNQQVVGFASAPDTVPKIEETAITEESAKDLKFTGVGSFGMNIV